MAPLPLKRLIRRQIHFEEEIKSLGERLKVKPKDSLNELILRSRLDILNSYWDKVRETHLEIITREDASVEDYIKDNVYRRIQTSYEDANDFILMMLKEIVSNNPIRSFNGSLIESQIVDQEVMEPMICAKLLKLDLPKFSGQFEDWASFSDLFRALVDSPPINPFASHRKIYLEAIRDHLSALIESQMRMAELIKEVATTNNNYNSTWQALQDRYDNPRLIVNNHLTAFMNLSKITKESANDLRKLADDSQRIVRALDNLDVRISYWDGWLVHILSNKLDVYSRKLWEYELNSFELKTKFPTFNQFIQFLEKRACTLGMIGLNKAIEHKDGAGRKISKRPFLARTQIIVKDIYNESYNIRALLDQGSEATFISENIVQLLHLKKREINIDLIGIGASKAGHSKFCTNITISSILEPNFEVKVEVLILPRLTEFLPARDLIETELNLFSDISLADPMFYKKSKIDMIIGADVYAISELTFDLTKFWNLEGVPNSTDKLTNNEIDRCELLFRETHFRDEKGRFVVRFPLKGKLPAVGLETSYIAERTLKSVFKRFESDSRLAKEYKEFMRTYESLGHMTEISASEYKDSKAWYLPHHAVVTSNNLNWKLRVVFDASRKTSESYCLNDFLLVGPVLQADLSLILLNWRTFKIVFTADIIKMFRQMQVLFDDQNCQRILWTKNLNEDGRTKYPLGSFCLENHTYVDDIFTGAESLEDALIIRNELLELLSTAGIHLDKWASNSKIIMQDLWILKFDWDMPLLGEVYDKWLKYCKALKMNSDIIVNRWLNCRNGQSCQLHCFSDASNRAYAACLYLRVEDKYGNVFVTMLMAKTKVAPVKTISIPNLELCGADNPADMASRGCLPAELSDLWWKGPSWLVLNQEKWQMTVAKIQILIVQSGFLEPEIISRYSNFTRLKRIVALCIRWITRFRNKNVILHTFITTGGRLEYSDLNYEHKYPLLLPKNSYVSKLIIREAHINCLNGGITLTLSYVQRIVWIINCKRLVKTEIRNCIICQRIKPKFAQQLMGNLPKLRITPNRAFSVSGIDYAGPIQIELTAFIASFRRFVGRRGICSKLLSDNATNFRGASKELKIMFHAASAFYKQSANLLVNGGTMWTFIPPNTPHYGGLWEAGVTSTKYHLKRIIGERVLTYEEMTTLLVEIEACLNSRPLCPLTNEPDDLRVLTPGNFLIGTSAMIIPDEELPLNIPINRLSNYQQIQRMRNHF
ncbi:uncharacterized protein [Prorops nasuta]|uniref:uncharacterized protein n=1 Tax=Prorops nasuta TaxID=863751 RepID=UPI0034CF125F